MQSWYLPLSFFSMEKFCLTISLGHRVVCSYYSTTISFESKTDDKPRVHSSPKLTLNYVIFAAHFRSPPYGDRCDSAFTLIGIMLVFLYIFQNLTGESMTAMQNQQYRGKCHSALYLRFFGGGKGCAKKKKRGMDSAHVVRAHIQLYLARRVGWMGG